MISRRKFVKLSSTVSLISTVMGNSAVLAASNSPKVIDGPTIQRFKIFESSGSFYRFIGMNAYDKGPKGINNSRKSCIVELSDGTIGLGTIGYTGIDENVIKIVKKVIGRNIFSFHQWKDETIVGVTTKDKLLLSDRKSAWIESAMLDALGKLLGRPVWKLFGESVRDRLDPYDGTLYFEEIANNTDVRIIGEIGKRIKEDGYRAIKMKLGRPFKWLPGEAGLNRDIEAFITLREAVGENINLMADANNGYKDKFNWAVKLMRSCAPYNMYYMEELFPDDKIAYLKVREELLKDNFFIPIGEGEGIRDLTQFDDYLSAGVYNYIQPDISTSGYSNILFTARKAESFPSVNLIPHVWQSQIGLVMSLHASKIQRNINFVEDSRYFEHVFDCSGYVFAGGQYQIPNRPGWGILLSPNYKQFIVGDETIIS